MTKDTNFYVNSNHTVAVKKTKFYFIARDGSVSGLPYLKFFSKVGCSRVAIVSKDSELAWQSSTSICSLSYIQVL